MEVLAKKELAQPFGLKEVAKTLKIFINIKVYLRQIMAVINANDDSFFEGYRFVVDDAVVQIKNLIKDGAGIIDIGAVSSKPNAQLVIQGTHSCD